MAAYFQFRVASAFGVQFGSVFVWTGKKGEEKTYRFGDIDLLSLGKLTTMGVLTSTSWIKVEGANFHADSALENHFFELSVSETVTPGEKVRLKCTFTKPGEDGKSWSVDKVVKLNGLTSSASYSGTLNRVSVSRDNDSRYDLSTIFDV